jgi:curli production assembly/transport component CsgF
MRYEVSEMMTLKSIRKLGLMGIIAAGQMGVGSIVLASELVYTPVNPSFGGNPLNGSYLLNNAQAQNKEKDPDAYGYEPPSDLERLASSLQSRLLGQLLADVGNGNTGSIVTDDFSMVVNDDGSGGLDILITDLSTGETTTISVNGLIPD